MPLDSTNFVIRGPVKSTDMLQFVNLFTGVMVDQPVTFRNTLQIGGNQGTTTVPLKLFGAPGQNTNLIDLYPDRTSAQPSFGFSAIGSFAWGPGGTAPQDTFLSRIAVQNGHTSDTAGVFINPLMEIQQSLIVGTTLIVRGASTLTGDVAIGSNINMGAGRINLGAAYISQYAPDLSYAFVSKLLVGTALTVNGALAVAATLNVTGNVAFGGGLSVAQGIIAGTTVSAADGRFAGTLKAAGYDPGGAWPVSFGGNPIAQGRYYQQANGSFYCLDIGDVSVSPTPNKVVIRDGAGSTNQTYAIMDRAQIGPSAIQILSMDSTTIRIANADLQLDIPRQLKWNGDDCSVNPGSNVGRNGAVYLSPHAYVFFDLGVGHVVTCQQVVQTSDPRLKTTTPWTDAQCMARVRLNMPVQSYTIDPPTPPPGYPPPTTPTPNNIGFNAPDVYATNPEFSALDNQNNAVGVNYANMSAMLWGALRNLDSRCRAFGVPA